MGQVNRYFDILGPEHDICEGVELALKKFKRKEKSKLKIKSKYAFGAAGKAEFNVPPNADVEYTITLNSFEKVSGTIENMDKHNNFLQ